MVATDSEIRIVKEHLSNYAEKVRNGEDLTEDDVLELDVEGGRIWVHPDDDGTTVDVHIFDDNSERDFNPARSRIMSHITHELDAPMGGDCEPYTPFIGNDRINIRVNLKYLR